MIQAHPEEETKTSDETTTKLRTDLVVSQQKTAESDEATFVVKDPETGKFYRFKEVEHFIVQQLDGSTPPDRIRQRVEERFGAPLPQETLDQFLKTLRRLGLVETKDAQGHMSRQRGRIRGSPLYLRFKVFDPDRLFNRLIDKIRFCFTPEFVVASAALILLAFAVTLSNLDEIGQDFPSLFRLEAFLFAWLTIFAVGTLHEFAHGLTCKHFGGEVHELGFLLLYFQPAFYCNVSEAWLFPKKAHRLWVTFAGPYFELVVWALATLAWRVTDPETWLNWAALIVMATSGFKTLFDLSPLSKLDGYYLLSDYLEVPNLRERAFQYIREGLKRACGSPSEIAPAVTPRERRIFLSYGLVAGAFSLSSLGIILLVLFGLLTDNYQGVGFVLFVVAALYLTRSKFKKSIRAVRQAFEKKTGPATAAPAGDKQAPKSKAALSKRTKVLAFSATVLAALFLITMDLRIWGEFRILPVQSTDIRAEVEGIVTDVYVTEGSEVQKGTLVARLNDRDFSAELQKIEAQIGQTRAQLKMLQAGPRQEDIEVARRAVETARTAYEKALKQDEEAQQQRAERLANAKAAVRRAEELVVIKKGEFERLKEGVERGYISRKEYDGAHEEFTVRVKELEAARGDLQLVQADQLAQVRRDLEVAEKQLDEAQAKLKVLLAGSRQEEIEGAQAALANLEAQRDYLKVQLRLLNIVSPVSGVITTPTMQLQNLPNQHVTKGYFIATVDEIKTVTAEITVSEQDIGDVQVGQPVVLRARSYPNMTFEGKVRLIATTAAGRQQPSALAAASGVTAAFSSSTGSKGGSVLVLTQVENSSLLLKPDMTGNAKIYCGPRQLFDIVTRRIARYLKVEVWSWW